MCRPTARRPPLGALWLSSLLCCGLGVAAAQEPAPPRFFACGEVRFFGPACPPPPVPTAPTAPTPPDAPAAPTAAPLAEPLFTPETVGPETPPLLLRLLLEPTAENAKAFVEWQYARQLRMQEVQGLIRELSKSQRP